MSIAEPQPPVKETDVSGATPKAQFCLLPVASKSPALGVQQFLGAKEGRKCIHCKCFPCPDRGDLGLQGNCSLSLPSLLSRRLHHPDKIQVHHGAEA